MDEVKKTPPESAQEGENGRGEAESNFWNEAKARGRQVGERAGQEWERLSENAKDYADEHSVGVALGSLGVGIAIGVLLGVLIARD
jgi:ElaB/YqjD/DUF883 family membrane-anchored ribosome-binding protein